MSTTSKKVKRSPEPPRIIACHLCSARVSALLGHSFCPTCWVVEKVLTDEGVAILADLADPLRARAALLWRASDVIRRSGVEDAEFIIRRLEQHL